MPIKKYLSLIKFSHTVFALPFAIVGFFLAVKIHSYTFSWFKFLLVILCMVFARSAAMAFNRYIDRDIDKMNPRTAVREIPAGEIKDKSALVFVIISCALFMICAWYINNLCFYLSPVALLVVLGYSYTKRFTALCHFILGMGLALAPIGAYLAVSGKFSTLPLLFSLIVLTWVSGFDIIYALQDEEFDRANKLNSIPAMLGGKKALWLSDALHITTALFVIYAGIYGELNFIYWIGAIIFIFFLGYQHTLVKHDNLSKVNLAFFTSNGIASVLFGIFTVLSLYM